jgi:hypothetical protein
VGVPVGFAASYEAKTSYDNFPLGIHGYRVDVQDVSSNQWFPLSQGKGDFGIGNTDFGHTTSELGVEVYPATPVDVAKDCSYWMPMYFTNWARTSPVGMDGTLMKLLGRYQPPGVTAPKFPRFSVIDTALQLRYGRKYQFQVHRWTILAEGRHRDLPPARSGLV